MSRISHEFRPKNLIEDRVFPQGPIGIWAKSFRIQSLFSAYLASLVSFFRAKGKSSRAGDQALARKVQSVLSRPEGCQVRLRVRPTQPE